MVGYYVDSSGIPHGYYRDANGALHFPIDPPGSTTTVLFGDNNRNWVVGRYVDSSGVTHGLFFIRAKQFLHFRLSRLNLYIAKRNQCAGVYLWSLRRSFRHWPRNHSSRQRHTADKSGEAGNEGAQFPVGALSLSIARGPRRRRFVTMRALMRGRRRGVTPNIRWMERTIAGPLSSGNKSATYVGF